MRPNQRRKNDGQICLLLPSEWIEELDVLAEAKFKTRLALIRQYLRSQLDHDLTELAAIVARRRDVRQSKFVASQWLEERKARQADEDW